MHSIASASVRLCVNKWIMGFAWTMRIHANNNNIDVVVPVTATAVVAVATTVVTYCRHKNNNNSKINEKQPSYNTQIGAKNVHNLIRLSTSTVYTYAMAVLYNTTRVRV